MTANEHLNRIERGFGPCCCGGTNSEDSYACFRCRALESLTALRATLQAAENSAGDDLCWIVDPAIAKALPEPEFLESCRRYRQQIADERGEVSGCRTIAQLEAQIAALTADGDRDAAEFANLLEYARKAAGRRDVHSIHEVLDQVATLRQQVAALTVERDQAMGAYLSAKGLAECRGKLRDAEVARVATLEAALRGLVDAIGFCTCQPFWDQYGKRDPNCAFHDCEDEIVAARAALSPVAEPTPSTDTETYGEFIKSDATAGSPLPAPPSDESAANRESDTPLPEIPCCPPHEAMWRNGTTKPLDNCFVCIRNQRDEVLALLRESVEWMKLLSLPGNCSNRAAKYRALLTWIERAKAALPNPQTQKEDAIASNGLSGVEVADKRTP